MLAAVRHGLGFSWSSAQLFRAGRNGEVTGEWSESLLRLVRIREHYHFIQLKSLGGDFDSSYMNKHVSLCQELYAGSLLSVNVPNYGDILLTLFSVILCGLNR